MENTWESNSKGGNFFNMLGRVDRENAFDRRREFEFEKYVLGLKSDPYDKRDRRRRLVIMVPRKLRYLVPSNTLGRMKFSWNKRIAAAVHRNVTSWYSLLKRAKACAKFRVQPFRSCGMHNVAVQTTLQGESGSIKSS